jgi:hypothetical protein
MNNPNILSFYHLKIYIYIIKFKFKCIFSNFKVGPGNVFIFGDIPTHKKTLWPWGQHLNYQATRPHVDNIKVVTRHNLGSACSTCLDVVNLIVFISKNGKIKSLKITKFSNNNNNK